MIITLRFPDDIFSGVQGQDKAKFLVDFLLEDPKRAVTVATEIEVKGPFGQYTETI